jgi:outer membrane protein TolC
MNRIVVVIVIWVGGLFVSGGSLSAQTPASPATARAVRLESLIPELLEHNPELLALRKNYEALLTRPTQEGALPDPRITMGWISAGYPFPGAGLGVEPTSNIGIQVAQELPYPGKRSLKAGVARKESEGEAQMYRAKELSLVSRMKMAFYELRFAYEALEILRRNQTLLRLSG